MNPKQMQYAVMLAKVRSFSQAAEQLGMSQPALSKQIISLEQELGVKLFDRTTAPVALTPAGEFFVRKAERLLHEEEDLYRTMERYKTGDRGRLTIGVAPARSPFLMPPLVQALKDKFPGLHIVLNEVNTTQLKKGIDDGLYDFAILNLPVDDSRLEAIPLEQDTLALAVPNKMLPLIGREISGSGRMIDFADCAALPFITLGPGQELRNLFEKLCTLSGIQPSVELEVVNVSTAWTMVQAGIGASVLPLQMIQKQPDADVSLFTLNQTTYIRQPAVVTRRGQYISPYAEYAISLLRARSGAAGE